MGKPCSKSHIYTNFELKPKWGSSHDQNLYIYATSLNWDDIDMSKLNL